MSSGVSECFEPNARNFHEFVQSRWHQEAWPGVHSWSLPVHADEACYFSRLAGTFLHLVVVCSPIAQVRVYIPSTLDPRYVSLLHDVCIETVPRTFEPAKWMDGMFWRFHVADDPTVERWLVRDLDSRPHWRDAKSVELWIKDGTNFFLTRDHPYHTIPILGGCFGGMGQLLKQTKAPPGTTMRSLCDSFGAKGNHGNDQDFLGTHIWHLVRENCTQASFSGSCPFGGGPICRKMMVCDCSSRGA